MKTVKVEARPIQGISIRTTNANELNPETARIAALYQRFDETVPVDYKNGARAYGVYYDYESDHAGEFSVLAGTDKITAPPAEPLQQLTLVGGDYLVFEATGKMPQVVIETWQRVWEYFSGDAVAYRRAYTTDFEFYKGPQEIQLYISVK